MQQHVPRPPASARESRATWPTLSHEHDWGASTLRLPQTARERFQQLPAPPSQYSAVFSHRNRFALPRSGPAGKLPVLFPSASFFDPEATVDGPPADSAAGTTPRGVWPEASSTTTSSRRSHRSTGTKFCVEAYRSRKAQREGLPASGEEYWREELQNRKREEIDEERLRTRHWKANVKPWLKERTKPRPNTNQRRLRAFRREWRHMEKQREERRKVYEREARALLKDVTFLLDHMKGGGADPEVIEQRTLQLVEMKNWTVGGLLTKHKLGEVEDFHRQMVLVLFEDADEDGSGQLERDEIKLLARKMGAKLSKVELDMAMTQMDDDGSGEVDFREFYVWWQTKGKESGLAKSGKNAYSMFFDVVPHSVDDA